MTSDSPTCGCREDTELRVDFRKFHQKSAHETISEFEQEGNPHKRFPRKICSSSKPLQTTGVPVTKDYFQGIPLWNLLHDYDLTPEHGQMFHLHAFSHQYAAKKLTNNRLNEGEFGDYSEQLEYLTSVQHESTSSSSEESHVFRLDPYITMTTNFSDSEQQCLELFYWGAPYQKFFLDDPGLVDCPQAFLVKIFRRVPCEYSEDVNGKRKRKRAQNLSFTTPYTFVIVESETHELFSHSPLFFLQTKVHNTFQKKKAIPSTRQRVAVTAEKRPYFRSILSGLTQVRYIGNDFRPVELDVVLTFSLLNDNSLLQHDSACRFRTSIIRIIECNGMDKTLLNTLHESLTPDDLLLTRMMSLFNGMWNYYQCWNRSSKEKRSGKFTGHAINFEKFHSLYTTYTTWHERMTSSGDHPTEELPVSDKSEDIQRFCLMEFVATFLYDTVAQPTKEFLIPEEFLMSPIPEVPDFAGEFLPDSLEETEEHTVTVSTTWSSDDPGVVKKEFSLDDIVENSMILQMIIEDELQNLEDFAQDEEDVQQESEIQNFL